MTDLADDLDLALALADAADAVTMSRFRALDLQVDAKPDLTPVTDADRAAEVRVRELLAHARPGDAVHGEEFADTGAGPRRWVLDPIDGTKNFVRGVPVWASLDRVDGRRPRPGRRGVGARARPALVGRRGVRRVDAGARRPGADPVPGVEGRHARRRVPVLLEPVRLGGPRAPGRLPRFDPRVLADPRLRRLLLLRPARRGRPRRRHRARGGAARPRPPGRDRDRGGRDDSPTSPAGPARTAAARSRPTGYCTRRRWAI